MKNSIFLAAIAACALSASVVSAQEIYPPSQPARTDKSMNMDMSKHMPQMEKIRATSDPKERQQLMRDHMQSMQDNMKMMHGMSGPMTMGDMMKRHAMMEQRMDMMQMMMEQMMQRDQVMEPMPAK